MTTSLSLDIVTPEASAFSGEVDMVEAPGELGDFGVLPGHSPFLSMLRPGVITIHREGAAKDRLFVTSGYAEVNPEGCTILAEKIEPMEGIGKEEATRRLEAAERALGRAESDGEKAHAERAVQAAQALYALV